MGILWPHSNSIIFNNAGARASGAQIHFFEAGTTTPRASYQDAALTTPHTHPVIADASGRAPAVFLDYGDYRERIRTSGDTTIWDTDDIPNPTPVSDEDDVDPNAIFQTGDLILAGKNGTRDGFVRWNGRSIGSATSSASERANPDCEAAFLYLWNNFSNAQCPVSGGRGATAAADWAANKNITLPDCRTAALIGFDDMGNAAAGLAASAPVVSGSAILAGSIIGANTHTLTTAQIPSHLHSVSITSSGHSVDHTHGVNGSTGAGGGHNHTGTTSSDGSHTHTEQSGGNADLQASVGSIGAGGGNTYVSGSVGTTSSNGAHTHTYTTSTVADHTHNINIVSGTTSSDHTHLVSGNTANTGSGSAHNVMQRAVPVTVLMKL